MDDFFIADEERIIAPEYISDDNDIETSLRPHALDEYVGQEKVKENLKIYIEMLMRCCFQVYMKFLVWY